MARLKSDSTLVNSISARTRQLRDSMLVKPQVSRHAERAADMVEDMREPTIQQATGDLVLTVLRIAVSETSSVVSTL